VKKEHIEKGKDLYEADRRSNKKARRDGIDYEACINALVTSDFNTPLQVNILTSVLTNKETTCKACGGHSHERKTNKLCCVHNTYQDEGEVMRSICRILCQKSQMEKLKVKFAA
jgi:hypothetical protein